KLDQSLDTIMTDSNKKNSRPGFKRGGRHVKSKANRKTAAAPSGGVRKASASAKAAPAKLAKTPISGESRIIVSNLPQDVNESLIKDFFSKAIGSVKKVAVSYGPNGRSRGEATVTFGKPDAASQAHKDYNNVAVDGKPMKIEIIGAMAPAPKGLADRMSKPKANNAKGQPKNPTKKNEGGRNARNRMSGRGGGRSKPKTAEELDAEMVDYFGGENTNNATAA
ncbi:hypothetical protein K470DRAFT_201038, partial [Piedraia hortae CBS 480.64]